MKHAPVLLFLLITGLLGCPPPPEPAMKLWGAQVQTLATPGVTMNMIMRVHNENPFDIQVRNVRVNVVLAGRYALPQVVYAPNTWLPAGVVTTMTVPVTIPWNMLAPLLATTAGSPRVFFHVTGFTDVTATRMFEIERDDWVVNQTGSVSRGELAAAAARGNLPIPGGF